MPVAIGPAPRSEGSPGGNCIILPASWRDWSDDALRIALLHELAHLKRRDGWSALGGAIAVALYWWHPAVHALAIRARSEAERAADDVVLANGEAPAEYASELVGFARNLTSQPILGVP